MPAIRSKNAGVNKITFDIIFRDRENYERVKRAKVLTRESMAALYRVEPERSSDFVEYDQGYGIKFTIYRLRPSGCAGAADRVAATAAHCSRQARQGGASRPGRCRQQPRMRNER